MYSEQRKELREILTLIYNGDESNCDGSRVKMVEGMIAIELLDIPDLLDPANADYYLKWKVLKKPKAIQFLWEIILGKYKRKKSSLCKETK